MEWTREEIEELSPILERIQKDLTPLEDKRILVLCSAAGDVALWLGERAGGGKIVGLELDEGLLELSRGRARERGLEEIIEFRKADRYKIPFADGEFDALVSEFVLFPTPQPTEIGQPEMARGLKPGGKMILTDVITTRPIPNEAREKLRAIGLDYLCEATQGDFHRWMEEAGLVDVEVRDFTLLVEQVWQARRDCDPASEHRAGYRFLLEDAKLRLGKGIFYIYVRGVKPDPEGKDGHTP